MGGRKKGTSNQKNQQWNAIGEFLTQQGSERFLDYLNACDEKEYAEMFLKVLEYFKPKQARVEKQVEGEVTITFGWQK